MDDRRRIAINQITTDTKWSLRLAIEGYARNDVHGIAIWRHKLAECGLDEAARLLRDHDMTVSGLCRGGMFPAADQQGRAAAIDDTRRAIDEAVALSAQCLVLVVGGLAAGSKDLDDARAQVADGIAAVLPHARAAGMPLAIEPLHPMQAADRACINTLAQANDLCDALGDGLGIALDVYHVWWDPALYTEIERAGRRILAFHVCDWLVPTTDLIFDRGMMGDGVIDLPRIRAAVEATGYDGFCEVEIFSRNNWWQRDADEVVRICVERCRTAL
jgi:sugar phosphate isomerase/epimerase